MKPVIRAGLLAAALGMVTAVQAEDSLRPEIGKHLQQAAELAQAADVAHLWLLQAHGGN